jgi:acetylornithine/succinyldiaminopimelate/putrescine aminotransferase
MASAEHTKTSASDQHVALVDQYSAHNYSPLPVVVATAAGVWITDVEGRRYMDFLSAYSAVNFGHVNPELTAVAKAQLDKVTLTSRAFYSDQLGPFCQAIAKLTGKTCANDHETVTPDVYILGKALGGGIMPVSAIAADRAIMDVLKPGDHGSTFGGNPFACAIGIAVCDLLAKGTVQANSAKLGEYMLGRLRTMKSPRVKTVRGRGLWAGIELNEKARPLCERLMHDGVLCMDTHGTTLRLAPPLTISRDELDWALERIEKVLA